jgi:RNA polymerase sigma-70 factor (ECF subfamily)
LAAGDRAAARERLHVLVVEHFDFVWRLVRRFGMARSEADDAAQLVFMTAVRRIDGVERGKERAFLYGTALRVTANLRRGARRRREAPESPLEAMSADGPTPDAQIVLSRARDLLDEILSRLPESLRAPLVLAEIEELSVAEIAELEGIAIGTAASRLRRARKLFQAQLDKLRDRHPFSPEGHPP